MIGSFIAQFSIHFCKWNSFRPFQNVPILASCLFGFLAGYRFMPNNGFQCDVADGGDDIFPYPGGKARSRVWNYFGFKKRDTDGSISKDNLIMSVAVCRICHKNIYANKCVYCVNLCSIQFKNINDVEISTTTLPYQTVSARLHFTGTYYFVNAAF